MNQKAYLTIDDGPESFMREKIDFLKKENIPALFFCRGDKMEHNPDPVIYAIQNGFLIGNHGYSHTHFSKLKLEKCLNEISRTDQIINQLYQQAQQTCPRKYFRYPFGTRGNIRYGSPRIIFQRFDKKIQQIEKHLQELGYRPLTIEKATRRIPEHWMSNGTDTYWTLDIREWHHWKFRVPFSWILKRTHRKLSGRKGNEIILMHDHDQTHSTFEEIVRIIQNKGFEFLPFPSNPSES